MLGVKNLATGYTDGVGPLEFAPWVHPNSGGGMYSTAEEMCLWGQALLAGRLLSAQSLADIFTAGKGNYGYGWFIFKNGKHPLAMHSGNIPGFGATLVLYFDQPNFVITIKKENGQLWNRLGDEPGAAEMVLRPLSETRFFNKMFVLFEVTFVLGEQGRATKLLADGPWGHGEFVRID